MVPNGIRQAWAAGRPVINGWLSIGSPFTAEIMAAAGYDAITIDMQHGALDYADLLPMLQALRGTPVTPWARVPWLAPGDLMKALDAGAYGIICPMVNTRADAELLASYVRYPPVGERSFGPTRVNFAAGSDYGAHANEEIICLAMIETAEAYANTEAIVTTPGIDGIYIGPADLTLGLTGRKYRTGFDREEPELLEAIHTILEKAHKAGKRAGLHTGSPEYAAKAIGWGFDLVTISNDVRLLAAAAEKSVATARGLVGGGKPAAAPAAPGAY